MNAANAGTTSAHFAAVVYAMTTHLIGKPHSWTPDEQYETNCCVAVDAAVKALRPDKWTPGEKGLQGQLRIWDHDDLWSSITGPVAAGIAVEVGAVVADPDGPEWPKDTRVAAIAATWAAMHPGRWHIGQVWRNRTVKGKRAGHTFLFYKPVEGGGAGAHGAALFAYPPEVPHVLESTTATAVGFRAVESWAKYVGGRWADREVRVAALL